MLYVYYIYASFLLKIIKALNLYRKKTGSKNFFWVRSDPLMVPSILYVGYRSCIESLYIASLLNVDRFILRRRCPPEQGLVVEAVMLLVKRSSKNGQVRLVRVVISSNADTMCTFNILSYGFMLLLA